mmetsp:Transcript_13789/g.37363  ORF Transcript_13789/g.37363 Transcript_13789/m.37363 type:complete len:212 (-) Transcript_13789:118-753(-)
MEAVFAWMLVLLLLTGLSVAHERLSVAKLRGRRTLAVAPTDEVAGYTQEQNQSGREGPMKPTDFAGQLVTLVPDAPQTPSAIGRALLRRNMRDDACRTAAIADLGDGDLAHLQPCVVIVVKHQLIVAEPEASAYVRVAVNLECLLPRAALRHGHSEVGQRVNPAAGPGRGRERQGAVPRHVFEPDAIVGVPRDVEVGVRLTMAIDGGTCQA